MNPLDNVLPIGAILKYKDQTYQTGGIKRENDSTIYLVTSSFYGGDVWEIVDSDKLLIRDGEKRIHRAEYRPDNQET